MLPSRHAGVVVVGNHTAGKCAGIQLRKRSYNVQRLMDKTSALNPKKPAVVTHILTLAPSRHAPGKLTCIEHHQTDLGRK